jgi:DNA-binding beta-propeller fold protein YncE
MRMNRRSFLGGGAAALGMVGCKDVQLLDSAGFDLPGIDDVAAGESHLMWDGQGNLYLLLPDEHAIQRLTDDGDEIWSFGDVADDGPDLNFPTRVTFADDGTLYVMEPGNHRISVLDPDGQLIRHIGGPGEDGGQFHTVRDAVIHPDNGLLYTADPFNHRVQVFRVDGEHQDLFGEFGTDDEHQLNAPRALAISERSGRLHVVDTGNARIQVYDTDGNWQRSYGNLAEDELFAPRSIAIDPLGNAYVSDPTLGAVQVYDRHGDPLVRFGGLQVDGLAIHPLEIHFDHKRALYVRAQLIQMEA